MDYSGKLIFDEKTKELEKDIFPESVKNISVENLKEIARGLRNWAMGCEFLEPTEEECMPHLHTMY